MAFFGVSTNLINCGTPSPSQNAESSEMSPYQAVLVSREVRLRGLAAAQKNYARLQLEYSSAYAAYQQLQADVAAKAKAVDSYFEGQEAAAKEVCEKAAAAKALQLKEGGNDYTHPKYAALVAGLSSDRRKAVDELLVPYFIFLNELTSAEDALWAKHGALQAAQEVYNLWGVELQAADWQLQSMPAEPQLSSERSLAEIRYLAQRVAEIRKKKILKRKKEKTVVRHLVDETQTQDSSSQPPAPQRPSKASAPCLASFAICNTKETKKKKEKKPDFDASSWL
ncbi:hypothetical protein, conserved [Eimeria tenella]|uniref:Uncharacterized protein n=1 Tax=Eimeria tenella TaxID=5802 RepID=U6KQD3_EIMTE|nr:hypothetical protein, conserved [Eimeria tenella]CDJ40176.1 hypothetical protein, conserved [Eimeria tenella]|eukprot:XP_013230929.1 hypothetical protein, conserved [Eimeria tenella]